MTLSFGQQFLSIFSDIYFHQQMFMFLFLHYRREYAMPVIAIIAGCWTGHAPAVCHMSLIWNFTHKHIFSAKGICPRPVPRTSLFVFLIEAGIFFFSGFIVLWYKNIYKSLFYYMIFFTQVWLTYIGYFCDDVYARYFQFYAYFLNYRLQMFIEAFSDYMPSLDWLYTCVFGNT